MPGSRVPVPAPNGMSVADSPLNQMQSTGRVHDARDAAGLQRKGSFLELLLHVPLAKVAQVAALPGTAAVGLGDGQLLQGGVAALDALLVVFDDSLGLALGACNGSL